MRRLTIVLALAVSCDGAADVDGGAGDAQSSDRGEAQGPDAACIGAGPKPPWPCGQPHSGTMVFCSESGGDVDYVCQGGQWQCPAGTAECQCRFGPSTGGGEPSCTCHPASAYRCPGGDAGAADAPPDAAADGPPADA